MPTLHSAISAATLCSAFSIAADVVLYSGTVGDGRCAGTPDSYYHADHECCQAKPFTCVEMETVHPELTPEVFDATNCSFTPSSCPMDTTNIGKDHSEFKPFHSYRLSSNGKILRARIPSPPVDPTTLAWSVEGVNYVIRSVIHEGIAIGVDAAIETVVNSITNQGGDAAAAMKDGLWWEVSWDI